MRDIGRIIEKAGNMAKVAVMTDGGDCQNCAMKGACAPEGAVHNLWAVNDKGGEVGDEVAVELKAKIKVFGTALVFIFPLMGLFSGYFIGYKGGGNQDYAVVGSVMGLVLFLVIVKFIDKTLQKKRNLKPTITHIFK